jgi:hypothetical protein
MFIKAAAIKAIIFTILGKMDKPGFLSPLQDTKGKDVVKSREWKYRPLLTVTRV